jgi:hypothetical protein
VTPQQLNARQGQVRCGKCHGVFNGFQALERFPDDDTGGRLLAAQDQRDSAERDSAERVATDAAETYRATPQSPTIDMPDLETVDMRPPAPLPPRPVQYTPPAYLAKELTLDLPPENPPSRAWWFGVALVLAVLLAELAFAYRGPAAQRYPALRPALEPRAPGSNAACPTRARMGCSSSRSRSCWKCRETDRDRARRAHPQPRLGCAGVSAPRAHAHRQQRPGGRAPRAAALPTTSAGRSPPAR